MLRKTRLQFSSVDQVVLRALGNCSGRGVTVEQLARETPYTQQQVIKALRRLQQPAGSNYVFVRDRTRRGRGGERIIRWEITVAGREALKQDS